MNSLLRALLISLFPGLSIIQAQIAGNILLSNQSLIHTLGDLATGYKLSGFHCFNN